MLRRLAIAGIVLAAGIASAWGLWRQSTTVVGPVAVPEDDVEIAWIHTTTSGATWERFVAGVHQTKRRNPSLEIDDTRAFLDQTTAVPEVVVSKAGRTGKIRFRWYKLSGEINTREWVRKLSLRDPPPVAFMGGGSSDRAVELARAIGEVKSWRGPVPQLLITTATANEIYNEETGKAEQLTEIHKGRTFRFCFTNAAMARAVVDFVWWSPEYLPRGNDRPNAYVLGWHDDPYSMDLAEQFERLFHIDPPNGIKRPRTVFDQVAYSVGSFDRVNGPEKKAIRPIIDELAQQPETRGILVLPTSTPPARRVIRAITAELPMAGRRMVAVNGDGIPFNAIYRDGDIAWPIHELAMPLIFFTHQNPVAWDAEGPAATDLLRPPTSTDDVLLFADMAQVCADELFAMSLFPDADGFGKRLRDRADFFGDDGNRVAGRGEYVIVLKPEFFEGERVSPSAVFEIYTRLGNGQWELVRRLVKRPRERS
jgi:hypothetical protein